MSIGFGLQAVSGSVGQLGGDKTTMGGKAFSATTEGLGTIAGFAGTGSMFGPWGAAIGAGVGVIKAVTDGLKTINSRLPELEKSLESSSNNLNRFSESGQRLLQLNEQYLDALKSTDSDKGADLMLRTQKAYAEELAKLAEAQRATMLSAIAQGKGQEGYAKVLAELQDKVKSDESILTLQKFQESVDLLGIGSGDKSLVKGLDATLAQDLTRGLDPKEIQAALNNVSAVLQDSNAGSENQALALMRSLAASESLSPDKRENLEAVVSAFATAAAQTDLSSVAEGLIKSIANLPKTFEELEDAQNRAKANYKAEEEARKKEIQIREAANAFLLQLQADTESIYRQFNESIENFIFTMEASAELRSKAGDFKQQFYSEAGAPFAAEAQEKKNIISASNDKLKIDVYKSQFEASDNFRKGAEDLLGGLSVDAEKASLGQTPSSQENELLTIKSSLEQSLLPIQKMLLSGQYGPAQEETKRVLGGLGENEISVIGQDKLVDIASRLNNSIQESIKKEDLIYKNSEKDLAIQAQQLVFQKAMSKLSKAQGFGGGDFKSLVEDSPDTAFNKAMDALKKLKSLGYSEKDVMQGKKSAVKGGDAESYGLRGEKPNKAMITALADYYGAASQIAGEPVLSTDSSDFKVMVQSLSDRIGSEMKQLEAAGFNTVDNTAFARLQTALTTLGGEDKVSQLKIMKEFGVADVGGKQILDEALKTYSGGAFQGLPPELRKAFEATTDEGAGATLLLVAGQEKQTDTLSQGLAAVADAGLNSNKLLAMQPEAIANAIGAVLETSKAKEGFEKEKSAGQALDKEYADVSSQLRSGAASLEKNKQEMASAKAALEATGVSESVYGNKTEVEKAKKNTGRSLEDVLKSVQTTISAQGAPGSAAITIQKPSETIAKEKEALTKRYNEAKAIVEASEAFKTIQEKQSQITKTEGEKKGLSKKAEEIRSKQDAQATRSRSAFEKFQTASQAAAQQKKLVFDASSSQAQDYINETNASKVAKQRALAESLALKDLKKTSQQKEAIARTSGAELTYNPYGNRQDTFENVAVTKYGGANEKAYNELLRQNTLPSLEKFSGVYASMGKEGGAKGAFDELKAEMLGVIKESKKEPAASLAAPVEQQKQIMQGILESTRQPEQLRELAPQQESPELGSILGTVNEIAGIIKGLQQPTPGVQAGSSAGSQNIGANGVEVSTPVSLTVNSNPSNGGAEQAAAVAEQIRAGISSYFSSSEFTSKVTSIVNQVTKTKAPPKVLS